MRKKFFELVKEQMGGDNDNCEYKDAKECPACDDCTCCEQCLHPKCIVVAMFWAYKEIGRNDYWLREFARVIVIPALTRDYIASWDSEEAAMESLREDYGDILAYAELALEDE